MGGDTEWPDIIMEASFKTIILMNLVFIGTLE